MSLILFECACGARQLLHEKNGREVVTIPPPCFEPATHVARTSFECSACWRRKMGFRKGDQWGDVIEAAFASLEVN